MDTIGIILFGLTAGAYGYAFKIGQRIDKKADKEDIHDCKVRINMLYEHLLNKPMSEEEVTQRKVRKDK